MTFDSVIVGSRVALPGGLVEKNIVLEEGRIVRLASDVPACDARIRADGLISIPGAIDPHVHYGVYSPIDEAATTESRAAALGGVTTMMRMLRLGGSYRESLGAQLEASASSHHVDYSIHASIFNDAQADEMGFCADHSVTSFKLYMNLGSDVGHVYMDMPPGTHGLVEARVEVNAQLVRRVVANAAQLGCPVLVHAEDYESCACGIREAQEKKLDGLGAWSASRPPESESRAIAQVSELAREFGCVIYFVHVGSEAALHQIRAERARGTKIFVETCPHYMTLSHETQSGYLAKVMPPVRSGKDVNGVWRSIEGGEVDTIGTDHVANCMGLKLDGGDVWGALAGFPGIGTSLPILLSEGLNKGRISIERLVSLTSTAAAGIFSMRPAKGSLEPGSDADIAILDPKLERKVSSELLGGFSDYTVYEGWKLRGWPVKTLVRGHLVAEDFEVVGKPGYGKMVGRPHPRNHL